MRLAAAVVGLALTGAAVAASAQPSPPARTTAQVALAAVMDVCRAAAVQDQPASVFAEQLGYARDATLPPGLPITHAGAQSWRVPSSAGEVHVISGAIPEPAQQSACMVAIYGDPVPGFEDALTRRITAPDIGFERDAKQSFKTDRFQVTHFDDSNGYLVRNVMVARPLVPTPDRPSLTVLAYRVDYSWLNFASH